MHDREANEMESKVVKILQRTYGNQVVDYGFHDDARVCLYNSKDEVIAIVPAWRVLKAINEAEGGYI